MNWRKEEALNFNGVEGDVKAVITPLSLTIYQNGAKVKKKGSFKPKFPVKTASGTVEPITIINGSGRVRTAVFGNEQVPLEEKLSTLDIVIAVGLFLLIFVLGCVLIGYTIGVIGGALVGGSVGFGVSLSLNLVRNEKSIISKILMTAAVGIGCYVIYFLLGLIVTMLFHSAVYSMY